MYGCIPEEYILLFFFFKDSAFIFIFLFIYLLFIYWPYLEACVILVP